MPTVVAAVTARVDPVAAFRGQRLTGRTVDAAGQVFVWGGGTYRFSSGRLWEISSSEGRPVGFYFEGRATLSWSAGDPVADRVFRGNAERIGGFETGPGGALLAGFERTFFMFSGAAGPDVPRMVEGASLPEVDLEAYRRRFEDDQLPAPEIGLAAAGKRGRYFEALIQSTKDIRHSVDEALAFDETLYVVEKPPGPLQGFPDARLVRTAGRRNVEGGPRARPRLAFDLVAIVLDVRERDGEWGSFEVEETLRPLEPLAAAAFRFFSGRTNSKGERALTRLSAIELSDGTPLQFSFEKDVLTVFFPTPRPRGAKTKIRLRYEACLFRRADSWELFPGGAWYPQPMPRALFAGSRYTGRVTVRAKKPLLPLASGEAVRRSEDGEWNVVETRLTSPVRFASAVAARFVVREDTRDGVTFRLASSTPASDEGFQRLAALFHRLRRLEEGGSGASRGRSSPPTRSLPRAISGAFRRQ